MALSWLFGLLNPALAAEASGGSIGRFVVLFAAALSMVLSSSRTPGNLGTKPTVLFTLLLGCFVMVHAYLVSPIVDVSVLKALSWTTAMTASIAGWSELSRDDRELLARQVYMGLVLLTLVSLPLLVMPQGYLRTGTGFQGVLSHPQAFGPTVAVLGAWSASRMFAERRPSWIAIALVALCLVLAVMTEARTGGVAMVLGTALALIVAPMLSGQKMQSLLPGLRSHRIYVAGSLVLVSLLLAGPMLSDRIDAYIVKRGSASGLEDAYEDSRGELIRQMWENIENQPFSGIGFGIASVPELMEVTREPIFDLPVRAEIEKGVMPLAVLEEVGIPGFLLVAAWLGMILRRSARAGVAQLAVSVTVLLMNLSESTLFSPGGLGLLSLVLLGWASGSGARVGKGR